MLRSDKNTNDQKRWAKTVKTLRALRWSNFKNEYFTFRGITDNFCTLIVYALLFQFVFPLLPGITFTGSFDQAVDTALVLLVMTEISNTGKTIIDSCALSFAAKSQSLVVDIITIIALSVSLLVFPALMLKALAVLPGYLVINGTSALIFATLTNGATFWVKELVFNWIWPINGGSGRRLNTLK
jgi:hypothetical protein